MYIIHIFGGNTVFRRLCRLRSLSLTVDIHKGSVGGGKNQRQSRSLNVKSEVFLGFIYLVFELTG